MFQIIHKGILWLPCGHNVQELDHDSLEFVIMGFLMGVQAIEALTNEKVSHRVSSERQRYKASFYHRGHKVCFG